MYARKEARFPPAGTYILFTALQFAIYIHWILVRKKPMVRKYGNELKHARNSATTFASEGREENAAKEENSSA